MIYLDYAASTPLHKCLHERLVGYYAETGNSQSLQMHKLHTKIQTSQKKIAHYIDANPARVFFTSGATESISTAIIGAAQFYQSSGKHVITFTSEHPSVLRAHEALKKLGFEVAILPVSSEGQIDFNLLESSIRPDTILVSINHVCNETGIIHDLASLLALKNKFGFMIHLDACQTIGKTRLSIKETPVDFISLSAHKVYGPQGIGALYIAENRHITPIIHGSHPVRSGTLSHALIQLMGDAYELAYTNFSQNLQYIESLRSLFISSLSEIKVSENTNSGVPHILNLYFPNATMEDIEQIRNKIYCQLSSACFSGGLSHVLQARHYPIERIKRSIRFSFGLYCTEDTIRNACTIIKNQLIK